MLIIFAGLPGSGKSTLAPELARRIRATYLRIDSIEYAISQSVLKIHPVEDAGYQAAYALARDNLRLGHTVITDCVNPFEITRADFLAVAEKARVPGIEVEVICSDKAEHKRRIETRKANKPNLKLPTWQDVLDREYHPFTRNRIVVDTAGRAVEDSVEELISQLPSK